ncbi:MAG: sigma-70 family RNA polymerase sigma factor [Oscillospiraceae bacterium]|jgi:RNA polymerase sigma-70 factor (ECF subfamily)|nr:sigma-70 family RNA polymerase sigma factor [Oscillospiraceae bacterium]
MAIQSLRTSDCVDEVIEKYSNMVYRLALAHTGVKHNADDIFQNVFLAFISKPRIFNDEEHLKAWLIRVTINKCKSLKSSAWSQRIEPLNDSMVFETKDETDLFEYLALLPEKYRSVIHLFYCEELSIKQICVILKARESTVRTWLTRARAILREKLKGDCFNEQERL